MFFLLLIPRKAKELFLSFQVLRLWDEYPFGAAWYVWSPGYRWSDVEAAMMKPSQSDDVFVTSNVFSGDELTDWTEGALRMVDKLLKII